jgi:hypothetical protein
MLYLLIGLLMVGLVAAFALRTTTAFLIPGVLLLVLLGYLLFFS